MPERNVAHEGCGEERDWKRNQHGMDLVAKDVGHADRVGREPLFNLGLD
jgi:hypothetical protein